MAKSEQGEGLYRFRVVARLENHSDATVYVARCYPNSPQPIYGVVLAFPEDDWGAAYSPWWACVGHDSPIPVPAGDSRVDTLHLSGPNAWDGITGRPYGALTGSMSLRYEIQTCPGEGACRLEDAGVSNAFWVAHD